MNRFSSPLRAGAKAAFTVVIAITIATMTPIARAVAYQQEPAVTAVPNAPSNEIKGFASSIDPQIPVVGIGGDSVIRVSSGVLTAQRVEKIRKKVGGYFLAFHEAGSDYVITDPRLVHQAFAYFSPISSEKKPELSGESANQAPTTERERQLLQQVADLQARLSYTQSQQKPLSSFEVLSPDGRNKLQALIQQAKASGKAVRIVV